MFSILYPQKELQFQTCFCVGSIYFSIDFDDFFCSIQNSIFEICKQICMALTVFWDIRGSKWGQHPEFWILFSVWFWWRFYYEISCPCFSNRFDQALMVVDINDIKGDQNGQTPNFFFIISLICMQAFPLHSLEKFLSVVFVIYLLYLFLFQRYEGSERVQYLKFFIFIIKIK